MLLSVAASMGQQPADAHDLVQDTLTRAWRSIDTFDGQYPRAWLITILRNAARSHYGKPRPLLIDLTHPAESREPTPESSAESVVVDRKFDEAITMAIRGLKPEQQELLVLVDIDGLSYAEAAAALGIPQGTVMSRLHRARAKVRKAVERSRKVAGVGNE